MAWIRNDWQMAELLQNRNCRQIKRVPGIGLKRTDASLAQHDIRIATGKDVLGRIKKLVISCAESTL
ncbi:hypothetical protein D3C80_1974070 [compost metagenome]